MDTGSERVKRRPTDYNKNYWSLANLVIVFVGYKTKKVDNLLWSHSHDTSHQDKQQTQKLTTNIFSLGTPLLPTHHRDLDNSVIVSFSRMFDYVLYSLS